MNKRFGSDQKVCLISPLREGLNSDQVKAKAVWELVVMMHLWFWKDAACAERDEYGEKKPRKPTPSYADNSWVIAA